VDVKSGLMLRFNRGVSGVDSATAAIPAAGGNEKDSGYVIS
jgi:hypothetical protein